MPLERGGRADKAGNRYEIDCIIYELLNLISEKNYSVVIEALGDDERGTDILVTRSDDIKEHQQCKARNASEEHWRICDLDSANILKNWHFQLNRDGKRKVALISPIGCSYLVDLHNRALNSNGKPKDFYDIQIQQSGIKFINFYKQFCLAMGLKCEDEDDLAKSIEYLKRIHLNQISEYAVKECIYQKIELYFCTDKVTVYNALVTYIVDGDIQGKEITVRTLLEYLISVNVEQRLIDADARIVPHLNDINNEYRNNFKKLREGLIHRNEFVRCIDVLKDEENLLISGNAGCGKSGCTEAIIEYCEEENIPYLAVKLDRKIPQKNCELWGQEMGFPGSISYALHSISKNQRAVIILDQLDALRWTQANSYEAILVCKELIRQISNLNLDREKKILIVFVCRKYDLDNDNNIKSLFEKEENSFYKGLQWNKIVVQNFEEEIVKRIVGAKYNSLTQKTRTLLSVPSNLYIWQHLDEDKTYDDCTTTSHLIERWFQQICKKSFEVGVQEKVVIDTQNTIVEALDKLGRIYVPKSILHVEEAGLDYLVSAEMLLVDGSKVGFVHQSILDYFISTRMLQRYLEGTNLETIIGDKTLQTPSKRYQIQMFLQSLLEYDSSFFVQAGETILNADNIRFYVKSVFYEILGQVGKPEKCIIEYVIDGCSSETKRKFLLNNVVYGNHLYVTILREKGILEKWFTEETTKMDVFTLLCSTSSELDKDDINFILERAFVNEEDDRQFSRCLLHDITKESNELFELRMHFYEKYPEWAFELYVDMKSMMQNCEERTIRLISFWLKNKISSKGKSLYRYEEELVSENDEFLVKNGVYVLEELLKYIPIGDRREIKYSDWSARYIYNRGLERATIELIKKANRAIIGQNPELFWNYYQPYMGKGYALYNEIILHGLQFMPKEFSNQIIMYLSSDLDAKVFDYTSGEERQLGLAITVIKIHSAVCETECLECFEHSIMKYLSPDASEWYKRRIEYNKSKEYPPVYWNFWGDMQYQLLQGLPYERLSVESKNLLNMLDRRFGGKFYRYINDDWSSGSVSSPITGKKLSGKQWLQIMTNKKLQIRNRTGWKRIKGAFIESSVEMYVSDFREAVKENPVSMIRLVVENKDDILPAYIDSLYSGVGFSEHVHEVKRELWEELFEVFPCDMESQRASYFCVIIEKTEIYNWSPEVIEQLKNIALHYRGNVEKIGIEEEKIVDSTALTHKALNCIRGSAARAMGQLLWTNKELFMELKNVIEALSLEDDSVIRMASLYAIWPVYNIDREWAEKRILEIYESDARMLHFRGSKDMLFRSYGKYKERVINLILKCFESEDKALVELGGWTLCEFYIRYNEFEERINAIGELNEEQVKAILHMAVLYLEYEEWREKAKEVILQYKGSESDVEYSLAGMFYNKLVDVTRDSEFLLEIMKSEVSKRMIWSFTRFLEESANSVKDYAEIILALCGNILSEDSETLARQWGIEDDISKLIIALYDECANSERSTDKQIAFQCLELWDVMFEKQIGRVKELSRKLMER